MKVKELMVKLKKCDENLEVILSKDSEGNDFSPLSDFNEGFYIADEDSAWSGEVYTNDTFDLDDEDEKEEWESIQRSGVKALILTPLK